MKFYKETQQLAFVHVGKLCAVSLEGFVDAMIQYLLIIMPRFMRCLGYCEKDINIIKYQEYVLKNNIY